VSEADPPSLSQDAQEAMRVRAVKLVVEQGFSQVEAAEALGVSDRMVRRWMRRFRRGGWGRKTYLVVDLCASTDRSTDRPGLNAAMRAFLHSVWGRHNLVAGCFTGEHVTYAAR
jgi:hypothetical protein